MADDPHHQNQSQTRNHDQEGLFSHIARTLGLGQGDLESNDGRGSGIAEPRSHVDDDGENDVSSTGVAAATGMATPSENIALDNDDDDMPPLQVMSDSEDEGEDGRTRNPEVATLATSRTPNTNIPPPISIPMPTLVARTSQRRARVDDDDDDEEGDRERDRRHPAERIGDAMRRALQGQENASTFALPGLKVNDAANASNNATSHDTTSNSETRAPTTNLGHPFFAPGRPNADDLDETGGGGGVPWVGLRAAQAAAPPTQSPAPLPRLSSEMLAHMFRTIDSRSPPTQTPPQHNTNQNTESESGPERPTPSLIIPVPLGALPTLLRVIGNAMRERANEGSGNGGAGGNTAPAGNDDNANAHVQSSNVGDTNTGANTNNNNNGNTNTNTNTAQSPPLPPFTIFGGFGGGLGGFGAIGGGPGALGGGGLGGLGGMGGIGGLGDAMPNLANLFSFSDERERDDTTRGRQIVDGLEESNVGLVKRLERVNKLLGEDEGSGTACAVCWESLVEEGGGWGEDAKEKEKEKEKQAETEAEGESFITAPSTPQPQANKESSTSSSTPVEESEVQKAKNTKIVSLPCAHIFHAECLVPWFSRPRQTTCPVCRFDVDPEGKVWGRRRRPMGFGGPFGAPPPGERLAHLLAEMMNRFERTERDRDPGATTGPPAENMHAGTTGGGQGPPPPNASDAPGAGAANATNADSGNDNDNAGGHDSVQGFAERFVMDMLGPALGIRNGNDPATGDGGPEGENRTGHQPRMRVLNSGQGGGPISILVDMGSSPTHEGNTNTAGPDSTTSSTESTDGSGAQPTNPTDTGNNRPRERRRGPIFTIGLDMFIAPASSPGFNPPEPANPPSANNGSNTNAPSTDGNSQSQAQAPLPQENIDGDGDVVMEFEEVFQFPGIHDEHEHDHDHTDRGGNNTNNSPPSATSTASQETRANPSTTNPSDLYNGFGFRRFASDLPLSPSPEPPSFLTDGPAFGAGPSSGYRIISGTATSMEDAMRQIRENISSMVQSGPLPMPVSMPTPIPPVQRRQGDGNGNGESQAQPTSASSILPPWMAGLPSAIQPAAGTDASPASQQQHSSDSASQPQRSYATRIPRFSPPPGGPRNTQGDNNDNTPMSYEQFVRSRHPDALPPLASIVNTGGGNGTVPHFLRSRPPDALPPLPPLASLVDGGVFGADGRPLRPFPRRTPSMAFASRQNATSNQPTGEREEERQSWTPPPAPGLTLRERVEKKEREAGLRCWDTSCGIGPSDEEPLVDLEPGKRKMVFVQKRPIPGLSDKGKGKAKDDSGAGNNAVCEHCFHPSCLVSSTRVMNSMWGAEGVNMDGEDDVVVSCPVCREEGVIAKKVWEAGAASP
ncbi:hypothetical protein PM082_003198 [Marasmius tenuissimus]|nr:hypothetical protein PM082_003198 [Marasmius tenuissimus]